VAKIDLQYDILNYTPASASPPQANFNRIEQHINQEVIERGGTVAMTAQLKLVGDPVAPLDAAPKQYVDQMLPIGIIMMYGGAGTPPGGRWATCNGAELEVSTYPALFAVVANSFSPPGTPAGRFHLPNLQGRFAYGGVPGTTGGTADAAVVAHDHSIDHNHGTTGTDSPDHTHAGVDHLHGVNINSGGDSVNHTHSIDIGEVIRYNPFVPVNRLQLVGSGGLPYDHWNTTGVQVGGHSVGHFHNVNGSTGGADRSLTTGGATARHAHTVPALVGRSGNTGAVGTNANLPPYVGVAHIMRIL
jgi:microcystin-dependent protein